MRSDIHALLDSLDLALASAAELFGTDELEPIAEIGRNARRRVGFLGETVVVALAGGTGSGKSSILNALAGEEVAQTGVVRPTTQRALAWIPANPEPGLIRLLDELEIHDRAGHTRFEHLAVIDLPDMDSYDEANLREVLRLIPRIDAVVWVFDPLKYNDRSIHLGFLRRLQQYQSQFLYVLNHADRLTPADREAVINDLWKSLVADGIHDPEMLVTAAAPDWGEPTGIKELEDALHDRLERKQTALRKLVTDVSAAASALEQVTGVASAGSIDFRSRWTRAREGSARALSERVVDGVVWRGMGRVGETDALALGASPLSRLLTRLRGGSVARALGVGSDIVILPTPGDLVAGGGWLEAVRPVTDLVTDMSVDIGGRMGAALREQYAPEILDDALRDAVVAGQAAAGPPPQPEPQRWWKGAGYVQIALTTTVVLALLAAAFGQGGLERGSWPIAILTAAFAIILSLVLSGVLRASGRAAGRRAAAAYQEAVAVELDRAIQRRLGNALETYLRARGELAAALATVKLEAAEFVTA